MAFAARVDPDMGYQLIADNVIDRRRVTEGVEAILARHLPSLPRVERADAADAIVKATHTLRPVTASELADILVVRGVDPALAHALADAVVSRLR